MANRPKHRRPITTDTYLFYGSRPKYDVQNDARCHMFGERHCTGICPRHDAPAYADCMARHATDSI